LFATVTSEASDAASARWLIPLTQVALDVVS